MVAVGLVDTTFARVDMASYARREIEWNWPKVKIMQEITARANVLRRFGIVM